MNTPRPSILHRLVNRFRRPSSSIRRLGGLESLESRQMLTANVLSSGESMISTAGDVQDLELIIGTPDATGSQPVLRISATPLAGSGLDLAVPVITNEAGDVITPIAVEESTGSIVVAGFEAGTYGLQVSGEAGTTGGYRVEVSLVGDVEAADAQVGEFEEMLVSAAWIQSSGGGNFVTELFYRLRGIDFGQDLYDDGLDANANGTIDADDVTIVSQNREVGVVEVDLRIDDDGPMFSDLQLANDTGVSDTDGITTDPTITFSLTDESAVTELTATLNDGSPFSILSSDTGVSDNPITVDRSLLDSIAGGSLPVGNNVLSLTAVDELGNQTTETIAFTLIDNNQPPTALGVDTQSATEDSPFQADLASRFSDPNPDDVVTFTASGLPSWASISSQGVLSGTPRNEDVGTTAVSITATDSQGATVSTSFDLTVINTNDAPTVGTIPDQSADEDSPYFLDFSVFFNDPDGDTLTYSVFQANNSALPAWLTADEVNGTLSGNATPADAGTYTIEIIAIDPSGETASTQFPITVSNLNDPPTLTSEIPDQTVAEDQTFSLNLNDYFSDEDPGDTLTFSVDPLPSWMSINSATGILSGTPADADVGTQELTITATDSFNATASTSVGFTVTNVNDVPVVEDQSFIVDPSASNGDVVGTIVVDDPDPNESLTFAVTGGNANGLLSVDSSTGVITVADASQLVDGDSDTISISVTDAAGASDSAQVFISVTSNLAPTANDDSGFTLFDNQTLSLDVLANDTDPDGDTLTVQSVETSSQQGASISIATTGEVVYDPRLANKLNEMTPGESITDSFTYTVSDGKGGSDTATVFLTVNGTNVVQYRLEVQDANQNPITSVAVGDSFTLVAYVQDIQQSPVGIFSAYLDVSYPGALATPVGSITHAGTYNSGTSGTSSVAGILDEVGGVDGLSPLGGDEFEVFQQQFQAAVAGELTFTSNATEDQVQHPTLTFGDSIALPSAQIVFGSTSITITGANSALANTESAYQTNFENPLDVNLDGVVSPLDALLVINSLNRGTVEQGISPDVNADTNLTPIDALLVINELVTAQTLPETANITTGTGSDVPQEKLEVALDALFDNFGHSELKNLTTADLHGLDSSLMDAILAAAAADEAERDAMFDELAYSLADLIGS